MKMTEFNFKFQWNNVAMSPIDSEPALVEVMAWRRRGGKPLPESMLTQFTDAYKQH